MDVLCEFKKKEQDAINVPLHVFGKKIKIHPLQNRITQANVSDRRIIFTCYSFTYGIFIRSTMNIRFDLHRGNV